MGKRAFKTQDTQIDFNVLMHENFIDMVSDSMLQLVFFFLNYHFLNFSEISKKNVYNYIGRPLKYFIFSNKYLCEPRYSSYNQTDAEDAEEIPAVFCHAGH